MSEGKEVSPQLQILECTLRDGNYAIDFKFTERDTTILAGELSKLAFKWIEVGHGFGLGASEAGKGKMPASDEQIIRAAKLSSGEALIGVFCIPGIAALNALKSAHDAGLDFVRIGNNAPDIEKAFSYIEEARKVGLIPFLNFMKTYAILPEEFAKKAKSAVQIGADVIYCVDSAGSMFPEDVARYFNALKEKCKCRMGFHAHNNLQLAIANAIQAYRCGANFIDTTLYGIGRSAGNVPTEVAIAVFEKLGIRTGIDLFEVMDMEETYMASLMSRVQMYDMLGVAMGYSQFHSSFLPKVERAARKYGVDLRRLLVAMGKFNPVDIDDNQLEKIASSLPKFDKKRSSDLLVAFPVPEMTSDRISSSLKAVDTLINGMIVTSVKQRTISALELVASISPSEDLVLADLIMVNDEIVLGRVTYGSYEILREVLKLARNNMDFFLLNSDGGSWATNVYEEITSEIDVKRIIPVSFKKLIEEYIENLLSIIKYRNKKLNKLLIYGYSSQRLLDYLTEVFEQVFIYEKRREESYLPVGCTALNNISELTALQKIDVVLCLSPIAITDAEVVGSLLSKDGFLVTLREIHRLSGLPKLADKHIVKIDPNMAYCGFLRRNMSTIETLQFPPLKSEDL